MRLSFRLAAVKTLRKNKKKKKNVGGRRSIVKSDSRSAANCREIPDDILVEILVRLPVYSLMKFKCVSKLWSSLISSRYFTNLFFNFSSSTKRECPVFVYLDDYTLFSSSLSNSDSTASFPTLNLDLTFPCLTNELLEFVNSVRGLMCFSNERLIGIINFSTRQVLRLPQVESDMFFECDQYFVWHHFGYDPVNDEYKVLSTISSTETNGVSSETQVFVLGDGASWRNTKSLTFSPPPHVPEEGGISINSVLYYGAWSYEKRTVLMSFNLSSEEFNLIELPMEYRIKLDQAFRKVDLIHYQDHVAVFDDSRLKTECNLDIWVLEDAGESKWSHKVLVLPYHQIRESLEFEDMDDLRIRGTSRNGEVTLCARYVNRNNNKSTHAFYNLEKDHITRGFVIDPRYSSSRFSETNLWEDVESIMYLEL